MAYDGNHYPETVEECWAEIDRLRAMLPDINLVSFPGKGWQPLEWQFLVMASKTDLLRRDAVYTAFYAHRVDDPPGIKCMDVYAAKVRKKLSEKLGLVGELQAKHGVGWFVKNRQAIADYVNRKQSETVQ